jgi:phosphomannomutase/phosphoglucomutase
MIPWLLVAEHLCRDGRSLSRLVAERIEAFPCSGEINFQVDDADATISRILGVYEDQNPSIDYTDGVSVELSDWRFNLRASNTEPLLRLNVETRGDAALMRRKTDELCALIAS